MSLKVFSTLEKVTARDERIIQQAGDTDGVIASFYDLSGNPSLFLDGTSAHLGNVGVKTSTPGEALTIAGNVSSSGYYYGKASYLTDIPNIFNQSLNSSDNVQFNRVQTSSIVGGNYNANTLELPIGFGPALAGYAEGNVFVKTGKSNPSEYLTWKFNHDDRSLTLPSSGVLQAADGSDIYIGSNLIPTTSAFYIGDKHNPVQGIYLAAQTLHIASSIAGTTGLELSNIDNIFTVTKGGLRSTVIYTGGLLISGNNIGADPAVGSKPMTIGTNGLSVVQVLVPMTVYSSISAVSLSGTHYGDGSHLINLPTSNPFNQSLNTTNNVTFSSLSLTNGLTAHNTTIIGELSCTGRIYASDVHAPMSVSDLTTTTKILALSDVNSIITGSSTSDMTITIPLNSTVPFPVGTEIKFIQLGTKKITITGVSGVNLANNSNQYKTKGQHAVTWLFQVSPDQWIFAGDTSP